MPPSCRRSAAAAGGLLLLLAGSLMAQEPGPRAVEVAVFPMDAGSSRDPARARLAEQCVTQLVAALREQKVAAQRAEPAGKFAARLTVHGSLAGDAGAYTAELRLLDGATGDELRSYMFGPGDAVGVVGLAERAAPRIRAVLDELRAADR